MRIQCKCRVKKICLNYLILTCDIDNVYHAIIIRSPSPCEGIQEGNVIFINPSPTVSVEGNNESLIYPRTLVKTTLYFKFGSFSCHANLMVILMVVVCGKASFFIHDTSHVLFDHSTAVPHHYLLFMCRLVRPS